MDDYINVFSICFTNTHTNLIGLHVLFQICSTEPSVPVISDMSTIHDLPKQIPQILPWHLHHYNDYENHSTITILIILVMERYTPLTATHNTHNTSNLCISLQVVVEDVNRYRQVSSVKGIFSVPTLGTKLPPLCHTSMEVTQREEDGLKLLLTTALVQDILKRGQ